MVYLNSTFKSKKNTIYIEGEDDVELWEAVPTVITKRSGKPGKPYARRNKRKLYFTFSTNYLFKISYFKLFDK